MDRTALIHSAAAGVRPGTTALESREVIPGGWHVLMSDGSRVIVRDYPGAVGPVAYGPDRYASVDLTQVREVDLRKLWDISATFPSPADASIAPARDTRPHDRQRATRARESHIIAYPI